MKCQVFFVLFSLVFMEVSNAQIEYPRNGGLESWTTGEIAGQTYDSIEHWNTMSRTLRLLGVSDTLSFRETAVVNSGASAVKLVTDSLSFLPLPTVGVGILTTAEITFSFAFSLEFVGGAVIDCTPSNLTGYYQYFPENSDTASVQCLMWNAAGDTIQDTTIFLFGETDMYTQFDIPLNYYLSEAPTLFRITARSSHLTPEVGSTLYIDNVKLTGGDCFSTSIPNVYKSQLEATPNPCKYNINIELPGTRDQQLIVFDLHGRKKLTKQLSPGTNEIETGQLLPGMYFFSVTSDSQHSHYGRFTKL